MLSDFHRVAEELYQAGLDDGFRSGYIDVLRKALEGAALSVAEPVSYQRKTVYGWREVDVADIPHYRSVGQEIRGLYAAPPAPSVTVKALGWRKYGNQHGHGWQGMGAIGYLQYIVYRGPEGEEGWFWADRGFDKEDEAKAAVQAHYESCIRSALSAQAQDLAI